MHRSIACLALLLAPLLCACPGESAPGNAAAKQRVPMRVDAARLASGNSFEVIEPVWWSGDIYGSLDDYEASLRPFSQNQRLLFALHWYIAEVNNGGHAQFYANSTGIVWPDALAAFEALAVPEGAALVRESAEKLGGAPSRERAERERQLEQHAPDFEDLDARFFALQDRIDLEARMLEHMRSHAADFYFDGSVERPAVSID